MERLAWQGRFRSNDYVNEDRINLHHFQRMRNNYSRVELRELQNTPVRGDLGKARLGRALQLRLIISLIMTAR